MPSGLVTVWIMHNKPPKEFPHTYTLVVAIATLLVWLSLTLKYEDVISASQQPEGAMVMTDSAWFAACFLSPPASQLHASPRHKNKPKG